ncbi:MAG: efflux RND transporter permease subunit [Candidatus Omnitrophica bacterium]|nr:efflux RND transporter permease subunit [Candidatus Omnitrophota bacterium]MCB9783063.1 efflux RND transporter permease subunit [Candidatus Omnitrophota bacterium]
MTPHPDPKMNHGLIAYMARNHVAANLLMLTFLIGGVIMAFFIKQETYPAYELDIIEFSMSYPGAAPEEVEEGIILAVEEEIRGLEAIKRIEAAATEGRARVQIELKDGVDPNRALQDVKVAIDRISSFPEDAEKPTISLDQNNRSTMAIAIYGDLDEHSLYQFGERVRNDLLSFPEISQVEVFGGRRPEISIEIPEATLRALNLNLGDIAETIRENAIDVPAGGVRAKSGEILLRTSERKDYASQFGDIPLISKPDGTKVLLRDVATIKEGFEDADRINFFNGQPGLLVGVHRVGDERPLEIAERVYKYIDDLKQTLPDKAGVYIMWNSADDYQDRINLLAENGFFGLVLVLLVLGFFLAPRLAFWVSMGIPVSIVGSLLFLPFLNESINMISLFAFIVTLGMVVDDAVIVGENVYYRMEHGDPPLTAAILGAKEMVVPVFFAVATNIIAFIPMLFVPGTTGKFFAALPVVVIAVFTISFIECLLVLPAHLSRARLAAKNQDKQSLLAILGKIEGKTSHLFDLFTQKVFIPLLNVSLRFRYLTAAVFVGALLLVWAYYQSGRINFSFDPMIESTRVDSEVYVPYGAPFEEIKRVADHVENAGLRAADRLGGRDKVLQGRMNIIGRRASNAADVNLTIVPEEERDFTAADFVRVWREEVGEVAGLDSLYFEYEVGPSGSAAITVELAHPEREVLEHAATELAGILGTYTGVTDINDGFAEGKPQLDFTITPEGRSLGITANHLGRQVRYSYYGAEALRQQRGRNEVKVMVRLPEEERRSMHRLEGLIIQTPDGGEIPLAQAADVQLTAAPTEIKRVDGKRVLTITANVIPELVNANKVREDLEAGPLPQLVANFPGLSYSFEGRQREQREALASLRLGLIVSLIFIFALIAALFRSYTQGLIVMSCIPFAVASALVGHVLMGYDLSIVSVFGMIALTGVAVNGALVLTVTLNEMWESGMPFPQAVLESGARRFRPIVLTSLTTFFGLAPMIMETSVQARFLVPMAISLGFGVLFSCVVVLFLTLAFHLIFHDFRVLANNLREGRLSMRDPQEPDLADLEPLPK